MLYRLNPAAFNVKTTDSVSVKITKRICRDPIFSRFNMKTIWLMCMMFGILSRSLAWSQRPPDANDGCVAVSGNGPYRPKRERLRDVLYLLGRRLQRRQRSLLYDDADSFVLLRKVSDKHPNRSVSYHQNEQSARSEAHPRTSGGQ